MPQPIDKFPSYDNTKKTIRILALDQFPILFDKKKNVKIMELREETRMKTPPSRKKTKSMRLKRNTRERWTRAIGHPHVVAVAGEKTSIKMMLPTTRPT